MRSLNRICVLGNIKQSIVLNIEDFPKPGETIKARSTELSFNYKVTWKLASYLILVVS